MRSDGRVRARVALATFASAVLGAATVTTSSRVHAQPGGAVTQPREADPAPAPPPPPTIVPPQLLSDEGAAYPPEALADKVKGTVEVVLVLELDATGAVKNVTVETPQGHGFDEAAVAAAQKLRFEPAKRNGQPVAAKIRHKYVFTPPASRVVGKVTTQATDRPLAGATVLVEGADGTSYPGTAREDGTFEVPGLPAGKYTIRVTAAGYDPQVFEDTIEPGQEARVDVRLQRPAPPPPPPSAAGGDDDYEEVRVVSARPPREVTKRTLEQRELARSPGTNGDALRAVQNLPGIARPPGLAGLLIVRGAAPQETGTFVDGTYVPIIYHFGGLSSVIPTEMLEKIDFYPGNFSSYFGRFTGGVVDVGVHAPRVKKDKQIHGLGQADLIDARFLAEGPLGKSGWNFAVGGRRSYVDLWLKPVLEQAGSSVTTAPVYYDYQAMLQRTFDKKHDVRLFFFGSDDRLAILVNQVAASNPGLGGNISLGTAFYRFQARYVGKLSDDVELRAVASFGKDALEFTISDNFFLLNSFPINPRLEISNKIGTGARNNFGFDILYQPYEVNARLPPQPRPGEPPAGPFGSRPPLQLSETGAVYRPAFYDELELTPFRGTRIVPGVRVDYAKDTKKWDVQPRLVARQDLTKGFPRTTIKGGIGRFAQAPQPQETSAVFGIPGLRSTIANHYGFGFEQQITRQLEVSSEGFYRQYDGIVTPRVGNVGEGRAYGLETLLRYKPKPDSRFFGFLAYTLSRSVRRDTPDEPERAFQFDQTHILTAIGSYRLGGGWEIGARFRLVSGNLRTPQTYGFFDLSTGSYIPGFSYPPFNTRNPMFHQLDVRVDKTWQGSWGKFAVYLDVYNAYNQGNVEGVSYNFNQTRSTFATGVPILPSIGFRGEF